MERAAGGECGVGGEVMGASGKETERLGVARAPFVGSGHGHRCGRVRSSRAGRGGLRRVG